MEKVTLYQAVVEKERKLFIREEETRKIYWLAIGRFNDKKDAEIACKLFIIANNDKINRYYSNSVGNATGNYGIREISCSNIFTPGPKYLTLDNFIKGNLKIALYRNHIGKKAMKKLLKEISAEIEDRNNIKKQQDKKDFDRIIDRMIRDYEYQIKINENLPVDVEDYKENVKLLEDLRDGKIELK